MDHFEYIGANVEISECFDLPSFDSMDDINEETLVSFGCPKLVATDGVIPEMIFIQN